MLKNVEPGHFAQPSRRQLLQLGTSGLFGLTLPKLLWAESQSSLKQSPARSCIFVVLSGGLSHIDTWDPKPDAPLEIRGPYQPIATDVPGVQLTEMFPLLAKQSQHLCLVRSLSHLDGVHVSAAHTMLTGQSDGTPQNDLPLIGSLVSKFRPSTAEMPSHVWLHNMKTGTNKVPKYNSGLSKIGYAHAPLRIGYELDNAAASDFRVREFDPPQDVAESRLRERVDLLRAFQTGSGSLSTTPTATSYQTFYERARELVTGSAARAAFDLRNEGDATRDRYGRHPLGQYTLMARRMIEAGVRIVTVTAWPGLAPGETQPTITQVWDMHDDRYEAGDSMFGNGPFGFKWSLPRLDQALSALVEDLSQRGLLDETLVAVVSEFGRTPKFEGKGGGRGHWSQCYTGLLAGGGIAGGSVYGASDKQGGFVASGLPISHTDFGATMFHALGIPPETRYGPDGFSFRVSHGQPVMDLFA